MLYRGDTITKPVDGMYCFVPAIPAADPGHRFPAPGHPPPRTDQPSAPPEQHGDRDDPCPHRYSRTHGSQFAIRCTDWGSASRSPWTCHTARATGASLPTAQRRRCLSPVIAHRHSSGRPCGERNDVRKPAVSMGTGQPAAVVDGRGPCRYLRTDASSSSMPITVATRSRSTSKQSRPAPRRHATAAIMQSIIPRGVIPACRQRR